MTLNLNTRIFPRDFSNITDKLLVYYLRGILFLIDRLRIKYLIAVRVRPIDCTLWYPKCSPKIEDAVASFILF